MAEYTDFPKWPPGTEDPPPNYKRLYVRTAIAASKALEALKELNIGEAKRLLEDISLELEDLHLFVPDR